MLTATLEIIGATTRRLILRDSEIVLDIAESSDVEQLTRWFRSWQQTNGAVRHIMVDEKPVAPDCLGFWDALEASAKHLTPSSH
jgi:hypothetical protein